MSQTLSSPFLRSYRQVILSPHKTKNTKFKKSAVIAMSSESGKVGNKNRIVICGGGIIGSCTAYFLSKKGLEVTVVERCDIACAASGKAGGFLALNWSSGATGKLANLSYRLHEELARELQVDYGYRKVNTLSVSFSESSKGTTDERNDVPAWITGPAKRPAVIGSPETTAQVHPRLFTKAILDNAIKNHGVVVKIGKVEAIQTSDTTKKVTGVLVDGEIVPADSVVVAMGPWSSQLKLIGQLTSISGLKAHSIILKPKDPEVITADMLFTHYVTKEGKKYEPEIYPRPNGEVYMCGMSEEVQVPEDPSEIVPSSGSSPALRQMAATISSHLATADCTAEQACFLPCSEDGLPVIGPIPGVEGAFVATGHSCWGILMAPATGLAMAELIAEGEAKSVDLRPFYPQRFLAASSRRRRW